MQIMKDGDKYIDFSLRQEIKCSDCSTSYVPDERDLEVIQRQYTVFGDFKYKNFLYACCPRCGRKSDLGYFGSMKEDPSLSDIFSDFVSFFVIIATIVGTCSIFRSCVSIFW